MKVDGTIDKYKAKLIVKGFKQQGDVNYLDTYSLVSRITSIQTLIAITTINKLEIHQMHVRTTFLNGDLEKKVYMELEGFIVNGQKKTKFVSLSNH
jgi:sRNA-binding regulator protein Hfq